LDYTGATYDPLQQFARCAANLHGLAHARVAERATFGAHVESLAVEHNPYLLALGHDRGSAQLIVLPSPFRSLMEPLLEYIGQVEEDRPDDYVTIILPEFVPARWWQHLLHNQRALLIKGALLFRPNTVVTSVPFHLTK